MILSDQNYEEKEITLAKYVVVKNPSQKVKKKKEFADPKLPFQLINTTKSKLRKTNLLLCHCDQQYKHKRYFISNHGIKRGTDSTANKPVLSHSSINNPTHSTPWQLHILFTVTPLLAAITVAQCFSSKNKLS